MCREICRTMCAEPCVGICIRLKRNPIFNRNIAVTICVWCNSIRASNVIKIWRAILASVSKVCDDSDGEHRKEKNLFRRTTNNRSLKHMSVGVLANNINHGFWRGIWGQWDWQSQRNKVKTNIRTNYIRGIIKLWCAPFCIYGGRFMIESTLANSNRTMNETTNYKPP